MPGFTGRLFVTLKSLAVVAGTRVVGGQAMREAVARPERLLYDAKRLIGHSTAEVEELVKGSGSAWPFEVITAGGAVKMRVGRGPAAGGAGAGAGGAAATAERDTMAVEEVSAAVLLKLKSIAERELRRAHPGAVVDRAVRGGVFCGATYCADVHECARVCCNVIE
jgi:molecular chaperone DnaK (HSP70)